MFCNVKSKKSINIQQKTLDGHPGFGSRLPSQKQKGITTKMKDWIVINEQPFSVVKDKSFRAMLYELNDSYRPVAVKTIRESILSDFKLLNDFIKKVIEPLDLFSIGFDTFMSEADDHFMDIHIIYFDTVIGKLVSRILELYVLDKHAHTRLALKLQFVELKYF